MSKIKRLALAGWMAIGLLTLAACGGGGAGGQGSTGGASGSGTAAEMAVLSSVPSLNSDGTTSATITVQVKDANNNALANQTVTVTTSDTGALISGSDTRTNANGVFTKTVSISNKSNRTIPLVVTSGSIVRNFSLPVVGSQLTINGPLAVSLNSNPSFTLVLRDSGGAPIGSEAVTISSSNGNTLTPTTIVTNAQGQAVVQVTNARAGSDTLVASAAGATASTTFSVASSSLAFESPGSNAELVVATNHLITVQYLVGGGPAPLGTSISYTSTRPAASGTVTTDATGRASFTLNSATAGTGTVTVTAAGGPTTSQRFEFVSRVPAALNLQSSPAVIGVNLSGGTGNSTQLIATVRDATDNPVKGVRVNFSAVTDPSNGSIDPGFALTDSAGVASVAFIAGPNSTGNNAVRVRATVDSTSISGDALLTVSQQSLFVRIGTGNEIETPNTTLYRMPWSAVVTDAAGNPVVNAQVRAQVTFVRFRKGEWVPTASTPGGPQTGWGFTVRDTCSSEDTDRDNLLDSSEDVNSNGTLEPGNIGAISVTSPSSATDSGGIASFGLTYPRSFGLWVEASIRITITTAGGTEGSTSSLFWVPIVAADATNPTIDPPGRYSPFGLQVGCTNTN